MANDQEDPSVLGVSTQTRIIEEEGTRYVVVPVRISVGEVVERRFPLQLWTNDSIEVIPAGAGKEIISFTGSLSRRIFELGRLHAVKMLKRRLADIVLRVDQRASELGWYPDEEGKGED